jgi:YVTN family beta-propeller protein
MPSLRHLIPTAGLASLALLPAPALASPHTTACATTAYVASKNSHSVTAIDNATGTYVDSWRIDGFPDVLAATPDGSTVYAGPSAADESVTPIDTATNTAGPAIYTGLDPSAIAVTPDGSTAYVVNWGSDTVTPIDTATNTAGRPIPVGADPVAIVITPDGQKAYVANSGDGTVTPIDLATNTPGTPIPAGKGTDSPLALAMTPDGSTVYAAGAAPGNAITPISTATSTAGKPISAAGDTVEAMQVTPDGKTLWAITHNGFVNRIDVARGTRLPLTHIRGELAATLAITPSTVYVGQQHPWGRVVPINAATGVRGPDIPGADGITGTALSPDGSTLWALSLYTTQEGAVPISTPTNKAGKLVPAFYYPAAVIVVRHCA